jgi:hypothetical protein
MSTHAWTDQLNLSRRHVGLTALALSAVALTPTTTAAQGPLERLDEYLKGEWSDLKEDVRQEVAYLLGMEAYVYGFPLVIMDVTKDGLTAASTSGEYSAPMNQLARLRTYVSPDFKNVVRISRNSLWAHGFIDLDNEPFVYSQPDTKGRFILMQAFNMWTDTFAATGSRTTGTGAGNFLLAGAHWKGMAPSDVKQTFRCSTRYAWILVQISAAGPQDFAEIHPLQDKLQFTPLSAWGKPYTPPDNVPIDPNVDLTATPYDQVRLMTGEMFFQRLALVMKDNPPYPADGKVLGRLKKLGIEPGKEFESRKIDPGVVKGLNGAPLEVWKKFAEGVYEAPTVNGWVNLLNLGRFGTDYNTRALVAWLGLGALTAEDLVYPSAFVDADGKVLDGASQYVMHFERDELPPSDSNVWSISAYRENFYVHNPIERYGLLSGMPLTYNADGSLDVYIQRTSPGAEKEANWLPCPPSGPFNMTIRIYQPKKAVLDGSYKIPPVKKRVG